MAGESWSASDVYGASGRKKARRSKDSMESESDRRFNSANQSGNDSFHSSARLGSAYWEPGKRKKRAGDGF